MTAVSPDARAIWRAARAPLAITALVLLGGIVLALATGGTSRGELDPESAAPTGSRALAALLRNQGVDVVVAATFDDALAAAPGSTVLVTAGGTVRPERLADLRDRAAESVLIAPGQPALDRVLPAVRTYGGPDAAVHAPNCSLPAAAAAGDALTGGQRFLADSRVTTCYGGSVASVRDAHPATLLGDGVALTNQHLGENGNAALAMRLLGARPRLVWYLPVPGDPAFAEGRETITGLLPDGWVFGGVQLAVAAVVFALWRARRLGPVVTEPLPVVVRAAETTEGRARLYRRSGAAGHAAAILREAAVARLATALSMSGDAGPAAVIAAVSVRSGLTAAEISQLLYGEGVRGDADLVRLADDLDALEERIRRS
ncbi:DUF4350 domain-containing protein [Amycolatopsis minnesotensis]|uniref:DUF4350 domain-containing protein n=1 Tax=Amycolatopsis minnesotensis TaxID=337894 RepID=A0ABN2RIZ4_9PSEU